MRMCVCGYLSFWYERGTGTRLYIYIYIYKGRSEREKGERERERKREREKGLDTSLIENRVHEPHSLEFLSYLNFNFHLKYRDIFMHLRTVS